MAERKAMIDRAKLQAQL
jgi:putative transposase